jgi:hypothetical protein
VVAGAIGRSPTQPECYPKINAAADVGDAVHSEGAATPQSCYTTKRRGNDDHELDHCSNDEKVPTTYAMTIKAIFTTRGYVGGGQPAMEDTRRGGSRS